MYLIKRKSYYQKYFNKNIFVRNHENTLTQGIFKDIRYIKQEDNEIVSFVLNYKEQYEDYYTRRVIVTDTINPYISNIYIDNSLSVIQGLLDIKEYLIKNTNENIFCHICEMLSDGFDSFNKKDETNISNFIIVDHIQL